MSKSWQRKRNYSSRRVSSRHIRNRILILCEGKKTEPNYFRKFPVDIELVEIEVDGTGKNTISIIDEAYDRGQRASNEYQPYNQIWCVFDRDSFPVDRFKDALSLARRKHIRVAYSNECFELWYYLHYNYLDSALSRNDYPDKLTELMGQRYKKNDKNMYELLKEKQKNAIENANKLLSSYSYCNPEKDNPSTTVHELVKVLNEFIKES